MKYYSYLWRSILMLWFCYFAEVFWCFFEQRRQVREDFHTWNKLINLWSLLTPAGWKPTLQLSLMFFILIKSFVGLRSVMTWKQSKAVWHERKSIWSNLEKKSLQDSWRCELWKSWKHTQYFKDYDWMNWWEVGGGIREAASGLSTTSRTPPAAPSDCTTPQVCHCVFRCKKNSESFTWVSDSSSS